MGTIYVSDDDGASYRDLLARKFEGRSGSPSPSDDKLAKRPVRDHRHRLHFDVPTKAIRWKGSAQRTRWLVMWKSAVMRSFETETRAVKLCWALEGLVAGKQYAYATDEYLSGQTGISTKRIGETLTFLERAGAIVRKTISTATGRKRRIYLCVEIIIANPPAVGGMGADSQSPNRWVGGTPPAAEGEANPTPPRQSTPPAGGGIEAKEGIAALDLRENGGDA